MSGSPNALITRKNPGGWRGWSTVNARIVDKIVTRKDVKGFIYKGDRISSRHRDMSRER